MSDLGHKETDEALGKLERRIRKVYVQAYEETEAKLQDYLSRFATKDKIKREQLRAGKITQDEYNYWRKGQVMIGKRWQEMVNSLAADYTNANRLAMSMVGDSLPGVYALNHDYGTFQVEKGSMVDTSYTLYDRSTVERLIRDNPNLLPKAKVNVPKDLRWNKQHVNNAVLQGILQGESNDKIASRLQTVTSMNHAAAIRNARTMTTGAENAGRTDSYKRAAEMGIELEQEWLATLDGRTRDSHRALDGERIPLAKDKWHPAKFSNGCRYPGDPEGPPWEVYNCRCTLVVAIKGIDQSDAPRNSKLGGMSYEEWKKGHAAPDRMTGSAITPFVPPKELGGIRATLGDDYANAMQTMLEFTEESGVKDVFYKYGDKLKVKSDVKGGGAYFSPADMSVHMNPQYVANGDAIARPYQTAFHEFGHNVDFLAATNSGGGSACISSGYRNNKLAKTIKKDWEGFKMSEFRKDPLKHMLGDTEEEKLRYFRSSLRSNASKKDYHLFYDLSHKLRRGEISIREVLNHPQYGNRATKAVMKFTFDDYDAINLIKGDAGNAIDKIAMGNVSDAIEFCTKISYPIGVGHGKSYWTDENGAVEFFAEVLDSKAANPASMEQMRKYFPNAVRVVEDILKEITK